ncbi:unnamed protein product [Rangifer tarandus platyrhynchus]|uniref:Uncharacterized protein n=2 Tax=Rangifer tarandus platyrhynchus TaxID=3082113 RepID=A0AC59ZG08_RANTA|nr:unnamed protein product [Rangifer tarandus platyrhynchus]
MRRFLKTFQECFECISHIHGHKALCAIVPVKKPFLNFPTKCKGVTSKSPSPVFALCTRGLGPDSVWGSPDGGWDTPAPQQTSRPEGGRKGWRGATPPGNTALLQQIPHCLQRVGIMVILGLPPHSPTRTLPSRAAKSRNGAKPPSRKERPVLRRHLTKAAAGLWESPLTRLSSELSALLMTQTSVHVTNSR